MNTITQSSVEPAASGPAKHERFYMPELDLLRFGAFFLVFLNHWIPLKEHSSHLLVAVRMACALGVPIFFALSSYLITALLERELETTRTVNLKAFYFRRILRIWPLYFAVLLVGSSALVFLHQAHPSMSALAAYLLLSGNIFAVVHGSLPMGLGPLWSIGVEEQFYLIWPWLSKAHGLRWATLASILISQAALIEMCLTHVEVVPVIWMNTLTHIQYFGVGGAIALTLRARKLNISTPFRTVMILTGLGLIFLADYVFNTSYIGGVTATLLHTYPGYLLTDVAVVLIMLGVIGIRVSASSPLVFLGKISFGLYVYHVFAIEIAKWFAQSVLRMQHFLSPVTLVGGFGLSVAMATTSYHYFESPFLQLKKRFELVTSRPI